MDPWHVADTSAEVPVRLELVSERPALTKVNPQLDYQLLRRVLATQVSLGNFILI